MKILILVKGLVLSANKNMVNARDIFIQLFGNEMSNKFVTPRVKLLEVDGAPTKPIVRLYRKYYLHGLSWSYNIIIVLIIS